MQITKVDSKHASENYILTDFNYATLTSPYICQKTVECKLPLLRKCHRELASSANTLVLKVYN